MARGRAVLPLLSYDITVKPLIPGGPNPTPRGVRLRSATQEEDLSHFLPHITNPVTDQIYAQQQQNPDLPVQGIWQPDVPYTFQRITTISGNVEVPRDTLLINPAQFRVATSQNGTLRRFKQMVLEVTYALAPSGAPPKFISTQFTLKPPEGAAPSGSQRHVYAIAHVVPSAGLSLEQVSVTFSVDGQTWSRRELRRVDPNNPPTDLWYIELDLPRSGRNINAFFEAIDEKGNVSIETNKGTLGALTYIFMPVGRR